MSKGSGAGRRGKKPNQNSTGQFDARALLKQLRTQQEARKESEERKKE